MKAFYFQVRLLLLEHIRMPAYIMASMGFPILFFTIFAVPEATSADAANFLLASFAGFAVFGVLFLQFAHGLAEERSSSWYAYLRTLPVRGFEFFLSRALVALIMAIVTAVALTVVAQVTTPVSLSMQSWLKLYLYLLIGGLVFVIMGIAVGVWVSEKVALPLGNLIYLPMSYAGGLWKPPHILPESVQSLSEYLPTRFYGEMLWSAVKGSSLDKNLFLYLLIWSTVFTGIAFLGVRRRQAPLR